MGKKDPARAKLDADSLNDVISRIHDALSSSIGAASVSRVSDAGTISRVAESISTRSIAVDAAIACGQVGPPTFIPCGRITELSGLPDAGKTTLCLQLISEIQSRGGIAINVDTEERLAEGYATMLGADLTKVIRIQAGTVRDVFRKQEALLKVLLAQREDGTLRCPVLLVWDSVGGTKGDVVEGKKGVRDVMDDKGYGTKAKDISRGLEIVNQLIAKTRLAYVATNQLYQTTDGSGYETPGGFKLKFYASLRIRLTPGEEIKDSEPDEAGRVKVYGREVLVSVKKNSLSPQRAAIKAALFGGKGFSNEWTVHGILLRSGLAKEGNAGWCSYKGKAGEVKWQGYRGFERKVAGTPIYDEMLALAREKLMG